MKRGRWLTLAGAALGALGAGIALRSILPVRLPIEARVTRHQAPWEGQTFPDIDITFLPCGIANAPAFLAVRGTFSLAPRKIAYSAVLIRHPRGTFLYDTGLCTDIPLFIYDQSWFFRKTLAAFTLESSTSAHLQRLGIKPSDLDFALLSHLHWDHVSGVPDLPGVPLRVSSLEYRSAQEDGLLEQHQGLVRRLMGVNPIEQFDLSGPAYAGFAASHDLFGDGSVVLVPLPGHTRGQVGMFVHRGNGAHLFLVGDAVWISENYLNPAPMHDFFWARVNTDRAQALDTLVDLHHFARRYPEIPMIGLHDARMQETFMLVEQSRMAQQQQAR